MTEYIIYDDSRFCTFSHSPQLPDLRSPQTHSTPLSSHLVDHRRLQATNFEQAWATKTTPPDSRLLSWCFTVLSLLTRYRVPLRGKQSYSTALFLSDNITSMLGRQLLGSWSHLSNLRIITKFRRIYWRWLYIGNTGGLKSCVFGIESRSCWQMDHAIFFEICRYQCWEYFQYISKPI